MFSKQLTNSQFSKSSFSRSAFSSTAFSAPQFNLPTTQRQTGLNVSLARNPAEVAEAQSLRYKVFAEETGAQISSTGA